MFRFSFVLTAIVLLSTTAQAQSRESLQLVAEVRMLQEDVSALRLANNHLTEELKAANGRLDDLAKQVIRIAADQTVVLNQVLSALSALREKTADIDAKVAQSVQEVASLRDGVRALTGPRNGPSDGSASAAANGPTEMERVPSTLQPSAKRIYDAAFGDYMAGRYETALEGFAEVVDKYPESPEAGESRFDAAETLRQQGKWSAAVAAYQDFRKQYPRSDRIAEAYFAEGVCNVELGRQSEARRIFAEVERMYPATTAAYQARQRLQQH